MPEPEPLPARLSRGLLPAALTGLLLALVGVPAQAAETWKWQGKVAGSLEVRGFHGSIEIEPATDDQVSVVAEKTGQNGFAPGEVKIEVIPHARGLMICSLYPAEAGKPANECKPGGKGHYQARQKDVRVDYRVAVPAGLVVLARTVNGDVTSDAEKNEIDILTLSGAVRVRSEHRVQVIAVNGQVDVALLKTAWKGESAVTMLNGDVKVSLPPDAAVAVKASATGRVRSDFALPTQEGRKAAGTIGAGGRALSLKTSNGNVEILRK